MRAAVTRLHKAMQEINEYMRFSGNITELRKKGLFSSPSESVEQQNHPTNEISAYVASPIWRRQVYSFAIVGAYGFHERFVRDLVEEGAAIVSRIYRTYDDIPDAVRDSHMKLGVAYAKDILDGKGNPGTDLRTLIQMLNACLGGSSNLVQPVFSQSTSNFRSSTVGSTLLRLGINISQSEPDAIMQELVTAKLSGFYASPNSVIDDLADRRNQIAHGNDFELLDSGTLCSIIKVVYSYDCWLLRLVASHLLESLVLHRGAETARVERTYTNKNTNIRSIASIPSVAHALRCGDNIYVRRSSIESASVQSIQVGRQNLDEVSPATDGPIGLDLSSKQHVGSCLYWLDPSDRPLAEDLAAASKTLPRI